MQRHKKMSSRDWHRFLLGSITDMSRAALGTSAHPSTSMEDVAVAYEQERGKPVPGYSHSKVRARTIRHISQPSGFDVLSELNLDLGGWRVVPDLCVLPKQEGLLQRDVSWITEIPAVAVESISPTQTMEEMTEKV